MKDEIKRGKKWIYWFSLGVSLIIIYKILDSFSAIGNWFSNLFSILSPFIVGIIIAYILYIPSKKLERAFSKIKLKFISKKARGLSVFIVYLLLLLILFFAFKFIVPLLIESFQDLVNNLQSYYVGIKNSIADLPEDSFLKSDTAMKALNDLTTFKIEDYISMDKLTKYAQGVISFASGIFDIFVAFIVSVYLLLERNDIVKFFKKFAESSFKKDTYKNITKYFKQSNEIFCNFLIGQLSDAIVVGIMTSIAMSIMHVKYAVMLGIFIGVLNMIPYFGAIIAVAISIFITLLTGGLTQAIEMAVVVIILQQVDANIINPKIVGDSVKISPLLVIFAVTVGGAYFGVMGMFIAVPVAAIIKLLINDLIEYNYVKKLKNDKIDKSV
mgnify:FL=1